ncbi:MAG: GNAT family N-acetyltransferase [Cyclobacteriaceae bacterium]|jgi:ribosomal protein S18 acetylase RimI-like enzyme|nr:GNAT family N-acetyltransferase [Cyclobacteriaceae bacterium]
MEWVIRLAREEDLPALQRLAIQTYRDTFDGTASEEDTRLLLERAYHRDQLTAELHEPGSVLYHAFAGSTLVGFLRMRENNEVEHLLGPCTYELQRLYIDKAFHGKKLAHQLMTVALAEAEKRNVDWLWLGVWERNVRAQRFYARWGFERFSEHTFWVGNDPQIDWLFRKRITFNASNNPYHVPGEIH